MTVEFALFLSPEGIALAHRQPAGHWALIDEAPMDGDDLDAAMAGLKSAAAARGGKDAPVLLVLPDDQVLYTSFMAPTDDAALLEERIIERLDGVTPYPVAELSYDWRAIEEDRVKVAVVAKETLGEATEFAAAHGFTAAGFAAMPPAERFPAMPLFGETKSDWGLDGGGMAFGSDDWVAPTPKMPDAAKPDTTSDAKPAKDAPEAKTGAEAKDEVKPEPKLEADTRDEATPDAEAADEITPGARPEANAAPETEPQPEAALPEPDTAPEAPPERKADAGTPPASDMAEPDDAPAPDAAQDRTLRATAADDDALTPVADPTLDHPIAPLDEDDDPERAAAGIFDPSSWPLAEPDPLREPEAPAQTEPRPEPWSEPEPATLDSDPLPAPTATRGKVDGTSARPLTAEKPADLPQRPPRAMGSPGAMPAPLPDDDGSDQGATGPALGFAARRGKAAKPGSGAGDLVSTRRSRFGFGAPQVEEPGPVLHPDAAPALASSASPSPPARPGNRLAAQLARVREASKARPQAPAAPPAPGRGVAAGTSAFGTATAFDTRTDADTISAETAGSFSRRRGTQTPPPRSAGKGNAFDSGLLARKPVEQAGPSFRTGLILTVVLLILLAVIAVWSVLFLPDSPMARLFTGGSGSAVAVDEPVVAPAPPAAVTAPPAIGALDRGAVELEIPAREPAAENAAEAVPPAPASDVAPELETATAPEPEPETPADEVPETATQAEAEGTTREEILAEAIALAERAADGTTAVAPEATPEGAPEAAALPDIDADLDLPPLPPLPEEALPSLEETERIYAEDGIWPRTPDRPTVSTLGSANEIYLASIDPEVPTVDAIAMAAPGMDPNEQLRRVPPPPPFGVMPDRDARGLVNPTPEGVLTPEGAFVVLGAPPVAAVPRPREIAPVEETAPAIDADEAILGTFSPLPRPVDLDETRERQVLGGFSATELAALRPGPRPQSAQESAARASLFPQGAPTLDADAPAEAAEAEPETDAETPAEIVGTGLAVAASRVPPVRPGNIAALVAAAVATPETAVAAESVARAPAIPSSADVTRAATERNAIRLRDVNLIGVTGTPTDRRALVRLPSGRFVRVGVGDRLDGGRVAAIGETSLQYIQNGRNVTLEIPG